MILEGGLGVGTEQIQTPNSQYKDLFPLNNKRSGDWELPLVWAKTAAGVSAGVVLKKKTGKPVSG